jgi:hypothetical protein
VAVSDLEAAERAYDRGDFAETRLRARAVLASDAPAPDKVRADELLARLTPDRNALVLLAACLLLFVLIFVSYAGR